MAAVNAESTSDLAKILVIAGSLELLDLLEAIMSRLATTDVVGVLQGQRGLELACSLQPVLIVLSLTLPDLPGIAVLNQLASGNDTCCIPVLTIGPAGPAALTPHVPSERHFTEPLDVRRLLALSQALLM